MADLARTVAEIAALHWERLFRSLLSQGCPCGVLAGAAQTIIYSYYGNVAAGS